MIGKHFSIPHLRTLHQLTIHHDVQVIIQLFFDGIDHAGVAVAHIADADAADQVNVLLPVHINQFAAFGLHNFQAKR